MDIFIAWSGAASKKLGEVLFTRLPDVIQAAVPFMSSESIRSGQRWFEVIGARLEKANFAVLCATPLNLKSTWLHFEAGAVSKYVAKSRVCAFMLELTTADFEPPLSQFQHVPLTEEGLLKFLVDLDETQEPERRLGSERTKRAFERNWPELEKGIHEARQVLREESKGHAAPKRSTDDILAGMLQAQQGILKRLDDLQAQVANSVQWVPGISPGLPGISPASGYGTVFSPLSSIVNPSGITIPAGTPRKELEGLLGTPRSEDAKKPAAAAAGTAPKLTDSKPADKGKK